MLPLAFRSTLYPRRVSVGSRLPSAAGDAAMPCVRSLKFSYGSKVGDAHAPLLPGDGDVSPVGGGEVSPVGVPSAAEVRYGAYGFRGCRGRAYGVVVFVNGDDAYGPAVAFGIVCDANGDAAYGPALARGPKT